MCEWEAYTFINLSCQIQIFWKSTDKVNGQEENAINAKASKTFPNRDKQKLHSCPFSPSLVTYFPRPSFIVSRANSKNTHVSLIGSTATVQEAAVPKHAIAFISRALKGKDQGSSPKKQVTKCEKRDTLLKVADVCSSTYIHRMFLLVSSTQC